MRSTKLFQFSIFFSFLLLYQTEKVNSILNLRCSIFLFFLNILQQLIKFSFQFQFHFHLQLLFLFTVFSLIEWFNVVDYVFHSYTETFLQEFLSIAVVLWLYSF